MLTATNDKARVHPASPSRTVTVHDGTMAQVRLNRYVSQVSYARLASTHKKAKRSLLSQAGAVPVTKITALSTVYCFAVIAPS